MLFERAWSQVGRPWVVVSVCSLMHLTNAVCLLMDPRVAFTPSIRLTYNLLGIWTVVVFVAAAVLAEIPVIKKVRWSTGHLLMWPQQLLLIAGSIEVFSAVIPGMYADGTVRTRWFIFSVQCPLIYLTIGHVVAIVRNAGVWNGDRRPR